MIVIVSIEWFLQVKFTLPKHLLCQTTTDETLTLKEHL